VEKTLARLKVRSFECLYNKENLKMYKKETAREFQRRRAVELRDKGESAKLITRILGVSMNSVYRWHKIHRNGGSLEFEPRSGRPRRLSDDQLETLRGLLLRGATSFGWHNDLWTSKRVTEVIRRHFNIQFSRIHVWVILTQYLGWSAQRPIQQLRERNDIEIERWKVEDFPRILKDADQRGAYLVFIDESGFLLSPNIRRTFAPRGQTPIIKASDPHGRISAIGAVTISPKQRRPYFYYNLLSNNANFRSNSVAQFVDKIQSRISGPITILWDAIPIHCSKSVNQYLEQHKELITERFPPYAPELNPVDKVWLYLKYARLPNYVPLTVDELRTRLTDELNILKKEQHVLASCVRRSGLDCEVTG
jgi:transposase